MICLRCGYCCHHYTVIIVDDPEKGVCEGNLIPHLGQGEPCKHLRGDRPGEFECAVHHYPWYRKTPCHSHGQIESSSTGECRMGRFVLDHGLMEKDDG